MMYIVYAAYYEICPNFMYVTFVLCPYMGVIKCDGQTYIHIDIQTQDTKTEVLLTSSAARSPNGEVQ